MRSVPSKPNSDAGFGPAVHAHAMHAGAPQQRLSQDGSQVERGRWATHSTGDSGEFVPPCASLTGRHRAPTGEPASTYVRVGGEGTLSRAAPVLASCGTSATQMLAKRLQAHRFLPGVPHQRLDAFHAPQRFGLPNEHFGGFA